MLIMFDLLFLWECMLLCRTLQKWPIQCSFLMIIFLFLSISLSLTLGGFNCFCWLGVNKMQVPKSIDNHYMCTIFEWWCKVTKKQILQNDTVACVQFSNNFSKGQTNKQMKLWTMPNYLNKWMNEWIKRIISFCNEFQSAFESNLRSKPINYRQKNI